MKTKIIEIDESWKSSCGKYVCPLCHEKYAKCGISTHIKVTHFGFKHNTTGITAWNKNKKSVRNRR